MMKSANLLKAFNEMTNSLRTLIGRINDSAGHVAAASEELTASVRQASEATEQITIAMDEISSGATTQNNKRRKWRYVTV